MMEFLDLIRQRKWDTLIMIALMILVSSMTPVFIKAAMNNVLKEHMAPMKASLENLETYRNAEILERGIAAYKKFDGLSGIKLEEKLESSTQNCASAHLALMVPSIRPQLVLMDMELTFELLDYFNLE